MTKYSYKIISQQNGIPGNQPVKIAELRLILLNWLGTEEYKITVSLSKPEYRLSINLRYAKRRAVFSRKPKWKEETETQLGRADEKYSRRSVPTKEYNIF